MFRSERASLPNGKSIARMPVSPTATPVLSTADISAFSLLSAMEKTLDALSGKIDLVLTAAESLRAEKAVWLCERAALEERLRQSEAELARLRSHISQARARVEHLIARLPERSA
ncbi:MAG: YggN family protein [Zoogloeaceae bacterium]|nr:YggN family protein [Zoogloeaceae bacterium]